MQRKTREAGGISAALRGHFYFSKKPNQTEMRPKRGRHHLVAFASFHVKTWVSVCKILQLSLSISPSPHCHTPLLNTYFCTWFYPNKQKSTSFLWYNHCKWNPTFDDSESFLRNVSGFSTEVQTELKCLRLFPPSLLSDSYYFHLCLSGHRFITDFSSTCTPA